MEIEELKERIFVHPGKDLTKALTQNGKQITIGFGLCQSYDKVIGTTCGRLNFKAPNIYWVDAKNQRYVHKEEDSIIAVVKNTLSESYLMDINGTSYGVLPTVAFDGATKRSRPNLVQGSVVFCRVFSADRDLDPELTCKASENMSRKDWSSGEAVYGELKGGLTFKVSCETARVLLGNDAPILKYLAHFFAFELAVGMNGFVWIDSKYNKDLVLISNAIQQSVKIPQDKVAQYVINLVEAAKK